MLEELGCRIVTVPGLNDADRGISYVNGIQGESVYLMPAYGGFFAPLDDEARRVFETQMGQTVRVIPILSSESQRRYGAVHCAVAAYPPAP